MRKTVYLANPYGFAAQWRKLCLPPIVAALELLGLEVWEPFKRNNQTTLSKPGWGREIAIADARDVAQADGFFGVVNGCPPDEGVMVELGIATALGKPIFLFRDDLRRCCDGDEFPLNLMLLAGLPPDWRPYFYESLAALSDSTRPLWRWAKGGAL